MLNILQAANQLMASQRYAHKPEWQKAKSAGNQDRPVGRTGRIKSSAFASVRLGLQPITVRALLYGSAEDRPVGPTGRADRSGGPVGLLPVSVSGMRVFLTSGAVFTNLPLRLAGL